MFGRSYGTPRDAVEAALADGQDILFDIDWQGFRQLRTVLSRDVVGVFIKPPSLGELRQRLVARGDDEAQVERRMSHAEDELSHAGEFDYLVENTDFETALADLPAILRPAVSPPSGKFRRHKEPGREGAQPPGDLEELVIYAIELHELKAQLFMISASCFVRNNSFGGRAATSLI